MPRGIVLALVALTFTPITNAHARWGKGLARRVRKKAQRIGRRITRSKAAYIIAPVRVHKKGQRLELSHYKITPSGHVVRAKSVTQDGKIQERVKHYYQKGPDGTLHPARETTVARAGDKHAAVRRVVAGQRTTHEQVANHHERLTTLGAYGRALAASPVVKFVATTGAAYLALEKGMPMLGVHMSHGQAAAAALMAKGVSAPIFVVRPTIKKLRMEREPSPEQHSADQEALGAQRSSSGY